MWHQGVRSSWSRCRAAMAEASPKALRTAWWMVRITVLVSFVMFLLRFVGLLQWVGVAVAPICRWFGLSGEAALALISGYFINVYSCVAVVMTLHLGWRAVTIIGAMTLAAHAMPVESAIQCKVGSQPLKS